MNPNCVLSTHLSQWPVRRGKVRDVYDLGERLLLVATDRISAFDWILPSGIPDKGKLLTQISQFWFHWLGTTNHLLPESIESLPLSREELTVLRGRAVLVQKTRVIPIECVVRGYLAGSGWKDYGKTGQICGVSLPAGLQLASKLPEPIFTPATKAETGHDENISFDEAAQQIGREKIERLRELSLGIYSRAAKYARERGIIIADTKFEFGELDGQIILIDEVLTPDSSRFWPVEHYRGGVSPPSYDKQFVRDWLETTDWDKQSEPPPLPESVILRTRKKYLEAFQALTGHAFNN